MLKAIRLTVTDKVQKNLLNNLMDRIDAQTILDKITKQVLGGEARLDLSDALKLFNPSVQIPTRVRDDVGGFTWQRQSQLNETDKYMSQTNIHQRSDSDAWQQKPQEFKQIEDILGAWQQINYIIGERSIDCLNIAESDNVYESENLYRCHDVHHCKNAIFCDGVIDSEWIAMSQRSINTAFGIKIDDSSRCSNSVAVSWSININHAMFIHDCFDLNECLFCSHIASKEYCIANRQYSKEDYERYKKMVVEWLLTKK